MKKNICHRVRKYRALQKARIRDIEEIEQLTMGKLLIADTTFTRQLHYLRYDQSQSHSGILFEKFDQDDLRISKQIIDGEYAIAATCQPLRSPTANDFQSQTSRNLDNMTDAFQQEENTVAYQLKVWAVECDIQQKYLDKLLNILRPNIPELPKSSKTFLDTRSAIYNLEDMADADPLYPEGKFVYFGVEKNLRRVINPSLHDKTIELLINVDGMPLSNSGTQSFWPILCCVYCSHDVYKPFTVAIYFGKSKPKSLEEYLASFITEINSLLRQGILIDNRNYDIKLKAFIADTPARAFLKCTKGHGGYSACERCTIPGERLKFSAKSSKTIYYGINYLERTSKSFIERKDTNHHVGISPLLQIQPPIDLTKIFVLDHMHLFFSGVIKRKIHLWMKGPLKVRLSPRHKNEIASTLISLKKYTPCEFQRKPRSIWDYGKWKATEFRFFLLYCGPIVLKDILPKKLYDHFMLLHVACRILCSNELALGNWKIAKEYLIKYVLALPLLYGPDNLVLNVHNLIHVADDVPFFNCSLSQISCFPFESFLGTIKRMVRTPNKPLSQVCRRLHEKNVFVKRGVMQKNAILSTKGSKKTQVTKIFWKSMTITTTAPDHMVLLKNNEILEISKMTASKNDGQYDEASDDFLSTIEITGNVWRNPFLLYKYPMKSEHLGSWKVPKIPTAKNVKYSLGDVTHKVVSFENSKKSKRGPRFLISLLH